MHKKYTYKNGKRFGPYYYETKRVNGKVVTTYLGSKLPVQESSESIEGVREPSKVFDSENKGDGGKKFHEFVAKSHEKGLKRRKHSVYLSLFAVLFLILLFGFIFFPKVFTGNATLEIGEVSVSEGFLSGDFILSVREGELIPAGSEFVVSVGDVEKRVRLDELMDESEFVDGNLYVSGTGSVGEGSGFGVAGVSESGEEGFGEEYLGEDGRSFLFDLDSLEIPVSGNENLVVSVQYEGILLVEVSEGINPPTLPPAQIDGETNDTNSIGIELNNTNITEIVPVINDSNLSVENDLNESNASVVENVIIGEEDFGEEEVVQYQAVLGQPVRWVKKVPVVQGEGEVRVKIPKNVADVKVSKLDVEKRVVSVEDFGDVGGSVLTGNIILDFARKGFRSITGFVTGNLEGVGVRDSVSVDEEEILVDVSAGEVEEVEVEYYTDAPYAVEEEFESMKRVQIVGPDDVHYKNILAFTDLPESLGITDADGFRIRWVEEGVYVEPTSVVDADGDGIYEYVEWLVDHLSTQTFEIIVIVEAEHLDSNRNFISDIYDEVKDLDGIWSEGINDGDYVRVRFEKNLTSSKDITVWPRIVSGNPRIEIYEFEGNEIIAEFDSLVENDYNKVFLNDLVGSQDVFDLRILGGVVEFDHIIDPVTGTQVFFDAGDNFADNWEDGGGCWQDTGDTYQCQQSDTTSYNMTLNSGALDLSSHASANLSFDYGENGANTDAFIIWVSDDDGSTYVNVSAVPTTETSGSIEVKLTNYISMTAGFLMRAECTSNGDEALCIWDNINVTGYNINVGPESNAGNVSQIYSTPADLGQDAESGPIALNFGAETVMDDPFNHTEVNNLTFNEAGLYKISYGVTWNSSVANRVIPQNWIRANSDTNVTPSETRCMTRSSTSDSNKCSNSAVLLYNASSGDYIELMGNVLQAAAAGDVVTIEDVWLYAQKVERDIVQIYDGTGGHNFQSQVLSVNLNESTHIDTNSFTHTDNSTVVTDAGLYKIHYISNTHLSTTDTNADRRIVKNWLSLNSDATNITPSDSYAYVREETMGEFNHNSAFTVANLSAGDSIQLKVGFGEAPVDSVEHTTLADMGWMVVEKINAENVFQVYEAGGNQQVAEGTTGAINFDTTQLNHTFFKHTEENNITFVNQGWYEVSYVLGWDDENLNDRHIVTSWIRKNGDINITPSKQADYSRGSTTGTLGGARYVSTAANFVHNFSAGDYIELMMLPIGGYAETEPNAAWLNIVSINFTPPYVDVTAPSINFVDPSDLNDSGKGTANIYVNVSSSDSDGDHFVLTDFDNDLLLWLGMDEVNGSGDPIDISGNGRNGSLVGTGSVGKDSGYYGNGTLNGDDANAINNSGFILDPSVSNFSIFVWANATDVADIQTLAAQSSGSGTGRSWLFISNSGGELRTGLRETSGSALAYTGANYKDSEWHHFGFTYNGTSRGLWADGVLVETDDEGVLEAADGSMIFANGNALTTGLRGSIDEIVIFNRTLEPGEVAALYNATATQYQNNFTDLADGSHNFKSYAVDLAGNRNETETRFVVTDTQNPSVSFVDPTNVEGGQNYDSIYVNLSSSDSESDHYSILDFNDDLLLWYNFDDVNGSQDPTDLSSYSNNGSLIANAVIDKNGYFGNDVLLDGTGDYVNVSSNFDELNAATEMTIGFWLYKEEDGTFPEHDGAIGRGTTSQRTPWIWGRLGQQDLRGQFETTTGGAADCNVDTNTLPAKDWIHLTFRWNGTTCSWYENGALTNSDTTTGSVLANVDSIFRIGNIDGFGDWNGSIDELVMFNRSLSNTEISALYNASSIQFERNFTILNDGSYSFTGYSVDRGSNRVNTGIRTVSIDTSVPYFDLHSPANDSSYAGVGEIVLNGTVLDQSPSNTNVTIYGGRDGDVDDSMILYQVFDVANGTEVNYNWTSFVHNSSDYSGSIVGLYHLDENRIYGENLTHVVDFAGNQNGTIFAGAVNKSFGQIGGAFDNTNVGSSGINLTDFDDGIGGASTYLAWVYLQDNTAAIREIFSKWDSTTETGIRVYRFQNDLVYIIENQGAVTVEEFFPGGAGEWYHFAMTLEGDSDGANGINIYRNGVLNHTFANNQNVTDNNQAFYIGNSHTVGNIFSSKIDEFVILNDELSASQVAQAYELSAGTYNWQFNATDGVNYNESEVRQFTISGAPEDPTPEINSTDASNRTAQNLHCFDTVIDLAGDSMNITVSWFNDSVEHIVVDFNNSYANGTFFNATLDSGNTTKGQNWTCGMRLFDGNSYSAQVNSSNLTIVNTLPSVTLNLPADHAIETDRTPAFTWTVNDDDGDSTGSEFNISLVGGGSSTCTDPDVYVEDLTSATHTLAEDLSCFSDNGDYYIWTARANDSEGFGDWATQFNLNISAVVDVNFTIDSILFGSINVLESNDTTDDSPPPFIIQNNGNSLANSTIAATALWLGVGHPSSNYRFKLDNVTGEEGAFSGLTSVEFINVPSSAETHVVELQYPDSADSAEIDIEVTVPTEEPPGEKNSILTLISSLAEG